MSRTGLHRPRRNRAVWDRPANGTRLLQSSSSYTVSPGIPLPGDGRSIDSTRHTLFYGHSRDCAHTLRRTTPAHSTGEADRPYYTGLLPGGHCAPGPLPRRLPRSTPFTQRRQRGRAPPTTPAGRAHVGFNPLSGLPRRSLRRGHATQRRQRVHAPIPPHGRALLVVETAPHRDSLASLPRPLRSTGLSQSRRRCGPSAVADNTHRYSRRRLPAQESGTFHPLPLPFSPSFLRRQVADAPRRESIPGRAGGPAPRGVPSPSPVGTTASRPRCGRPEWGVHTPPHPRKEPQSPMPIPSPSPAPPSQEDGGNFSRRTIIQARTFD